ncbi:MAG: fungal specific transcription factor domain-containing protein [Comamonadaceae bacterium]|nr:MAG: fungal specific transcription factor domain-containing protein [Comamonadaceae bacterium]
MASQQHVPQAEAALYMQTAAMYPGTQQNASYQQQAQNRNSLPSVQIPAPPTTYATSNAPLESPSLNISSATQGGLSAGPSSVTQDQDFPPYDLLYALTDLYFKHVNTWCPILHRRTTLDSLFGSSALEEADRILLHAIVATTLRFSTDSRLTPQLRERYHAASKQRVLLYGLENSSVKALQALVILALDIVGSSNGPPGWNLRGDVPAPGPPGHRPRHRRRS